MFQSNSNHFTEILRDGDGSVPHGHLFQQVGEDAGLITIMYACVWSNSQVETFDKPQPIMVANTCLSREVKFSTTYQIMISDPLMSKSYN
jgi:hypothetical protein